MTNGSEKPMDMKFKLKANLNCSSSLSGKESEIKVFVDVCNTDLLKRGAPPGCGANISGWHVSAENFDIVVKHHSSPSLTLLSILS